MNRDEELVAAWFVDHNRTVLHMRNGEDPPDLVLDGDIAVEITTIVSHAHQSLWDFIEGICRSLGPAEDKRGYWIDFASDDEELLQNKDKGKVAAIKRDIRRAAKDALRNHYANPDATAHGRERQIDFPPRTIHIPLPHSVRLGVVQRISKNRDNVKYNVCTGGATSGVLVVSHLIDTIQSAIRKKTANPIIQERTGKYREWWLVVTDTTEQEPHLDNDEFQTLVDAIEPCAPWQRILLANIVQGKVSRFVDLTGSGRRDAM